MADNDHLDITMDGGEGKPRIEGQLDVNVTTSDAIEAARHVAAAMKELSDRIATVSDQGIRQKHIIWGVIFSVALDVGLSVIALIGLNTASNANASAQAASAANQQTLYSTCTAANVSRGENKALWNFALDSLARADPSMTSSAGMAAFRQMITSTFAPKDCALILMTPAPTTTTTGTK
jgi:hypothetical protein